MSLAEGSESSALDGKAVCVATLMPSPVCIMRRPPVFWAATGVTEVTWHLARGSLDTATMVVHNASCFVWPNDSTVSLDMMNVMNTTSIFTNGGGGGGGDGGVRTGPTKLSLQEVAGEVSERRPGDTTLPLAPSRIQPRYTGHCLLRFDSAALPAATIE